MDFLVVKTPDTALVLQDYLQWDIIFQWIIFLQIDENQYEWSLLLSTTLWFTLYIESLLSLLR